MDQPGNQRLLHAATRTATQSAQRSKQLIGLAALVLFVLAWVAQAEYSQYLQRKLGYNKPFMVMYINHGSMCVMLPLVWMFRASTGSTVLQRAASDCGSSQRTLFRSCGLLSLLYMVGDYLWYLALPLTTVSHPALDTTSPKRPALPAPLPAVAGSHSGG